MRTPTQCARARIAAASGGVTALIALAALAACSSASGTITSTAAGQAGARQSAQGPRNADYDSTQAIITCYRQHGDPSAPDPTYDPSDGRWHLDAGYVPDPTRRACQHLFPTANPSPPVPRAQFQALVRLAECIRQHGEPQWPDPNPAGQFPLPQSLQTKTQAEENALGACQRYIPSGGIDAIQAP
jgi:hypothetical protein